MINDVPYMVGLNDEKLSQAKDKDEFKRIVSQYMRHYPHYRVTKVIKHPLLKSWWAVCEKR